MHKGKKTLTKPAPLPVLDVTQFNRDGEPPLTFTQFMAERRRRGLATPKSYRLKGMPDAAFRVTDGEVQTM